MTGLALVLATLLFLYVVVGEPYLGVVYYRRLRKRLGVDPLARLRYYRLLIGWESAWVPAIGLVLLAAGLGPEVLGLVAPSEDGWLMLVAVLLGAAASVYVMRATPAARRTVVTPAERVSALLPTTPDERRLFAGLALVAGVCEELLFRGFVGFYLQSIFPGIPLAAVVVISGVIFGLAHLYQGRAGVIQTGLMGVAFYLVYWFSDSLLPVMLLHAVSDLRTLLVLPSGQARSW